MATLKMARILRANGAPFTDEQIETMTDADGWQWIYDHKPPARAKQEAVCFTGFRDEEETDLANAARAAGFHVASKVTKSLAYLVRGATAGPVKIRTAEEQGATILDAAEFRALCESRAAKS